METAGTNKPSTTSYNEKKTQANDNNNNNNNDNNNENNLTTNLSIELEEEVTKLTSLSEKLAKLNENDLTKSEITSILHLYEEIEKIQTHLTVLIPSISLKLTLHNNHFLNNINNNNNNDNKNNIESTIKQFLAISNNNNNINNKREVDNILLRQMFPLTRFDQTSSLSFDYQNKKIIFPPWDEENMHNNNNNNNKNNNNENNLNININNENDLNNKEKKSLMNKISKIFKKPKLNNNLNNSLKSIDEPIILIPVGGVAGKSPFIERFLRDTYSSVIIFLLLSIYLF